MNEMRTGRHCVFMMHAHLIFLTKYRGQVFSNEHLTKLEALMRGICRQFEVELKEFNGAADHIHMLIDFPPKVAISKLVNSLKGVSSRKMKMFFPELHKPVWKSDALWSPSYFAGSVGGASLEAVKQYIEQQSRPH